jgi:hypothetical protein
MLAIIRLPPNTPSLRKISTRKNINDDILWQSVTTALQKKKYEGLKILISRLAHLFHLCIKINPYLTVCYPTSGQTRYPSFKIEYTLSKL